VNKFLTTDLKPLIRWLGVSVSALSVLFAFLTYLGLWNELRGDNLVAALASRLDTSYAQVSRQVREGDKEWPPLMRLIKKNTHADLPKDKTPIVFARQVAVASFKQEGSEAEWTAPTTPIILLYKELGHGDPLSADDWRIVGTIEDLHNWVRADEADFDFLVRTIMFGILSVCVGIFLALPDKPKPDVKTQS
jgi:hypothetical protein